MSERQPGKRLTHAAMAKLSGLAGTGLDEFLAGWNALAVAERRRAVRSMVQLTEENVDLDLDNLFLRLLADADPDVRACAVEGLWEDTRATTAETLIRLAREDGAETVRAAALEGVGRFAYRLAMDEIGEHLGATIRALLVEMTGRDVPEAVRRRAIEASGYLDEEPFNTTIRGAYADGSPQLRASAIRAMGRTADSATWLETIVTELTNADPNIRYEAARAAGEIADERAASALIRALRDDDTEVRLAIIEALGAVGGQAARETLHRLRRAEDPALAQAAEDALDELDLGSDPLGVRVRDVNPN